MHTNCNNSFLFLLRNYIFQHSKNNAFVFYNFLFELSFCNNTIELKHIKLNSFYSTCLTIVVANEFVNFSINVAKTYITS